MILLAGLLYIGLRSTKNIANQEREILTPAPSATQFSDPASSPVDTPPVSAITPFSPTATDTPPSNSAIQQSASYSSSDGYDPGIGFVDMNRIFKEYSKTKDSEKTINEAKDAAKREYDIRAAAYTKLLDEINRLNAQDESLNAAAKVAKAKERVEKIATIKNTEKEINEFRTAREKELQDLAVQMRTELVRDITREIASLYSISTSKGILYDRSAYSLNGVPIVTFSPDRADMSDKVISALNQKTRSAFTLAHDLVFGVVDMNRIFKSYNKTKDAEAQINAAKLAAKKEYDQRSDSHKAALEAANKAPAAERDEKIRKVKSMEKEINEFRETRERQLQEQALKLRAGIVKEITDAIGQGIGRTSGAVIIDISGPGASGTPITMFNSGVPDYSEDVIAALNGSAAVKFHASLLSSKKLRFGVIDMNRAFKSWPGPKPDEAASDAATDATRKKELQEAATKMRQDIVANIGSALKAIASREKFNLVFDSSGNSMNGVPITLLTPGIPDLTDKVLQK
jgi:outer membrane protein